MENSINEAVEARSVVMSDDGNASSLTLLQRFNQARDVVLNCEERPAKVPSSYDPVSSLLQIQKDIALQSLFSKNETVEDISTPLLPLLTVEHLLAMAYCNSTHPGGGLVDRCHRLVRAGELWAMFLSRLEDFELFGASANGEDYKHFRALLEYSSSHSEDDSVHVPTVPSVTRDVKIARFRERQQTQNEMSRLQSLQQRRERLSVSELDEMDGYDGEQLSREIALRSIDDARMQALEEWTSTLQELPLLQRMIQKQQNSGGTTGSGSREQLSSPTDSRQPQQPPPPLRVTHITRDDTLPGGLRMERQEIQRSVFRPGWNQPTMTLEELAEHEVREAQARSQRQAEYEASQTNAPRKYEQLVRDGREDDADLVDASATLDRQWDDWKDENPRGSGNKRANVGDRNF
jgi:immunoglobulin-binding protein 1